MKMRLIRIAFVVTVLLVLLCETRSASAQWTAGDAQRAYTAYNNAFLQTEPDGYSKYFATVQGGTTPEDFWRFAEEIDMADDAYFENKTTANQTEVQALCDGFIYLHGDTWTSDTYNDDIKRGSYGIRKSVPGYGHHQVAERCEEQLHGSVEPRTSG